MSAENFKHQLSSGQIQLQSLDPVFIWTPEELQLHNPSLSNFLVSCPEVPDPPPVTSRSFTTADAASSLLMLSGYPESSILESAPKQTNLKVKGKANKEPTKIQRDAKERKKQVAEKKARKKCNVKSLLLLFYKTLISFAAIFRNEKTRGK